jgi:hypothetical protein
MRTSAGCAAHAITSSGVHEAGGVFAQAREQALALVRRVAIGPCSAQQQRSLGFCQRRQCGEFGAGHVAVDDEDDEVADAGDVECEALALLA